MLILGTIKTEIFYGKQRKCIRTRSHMNKATQYACITSKSGSIKLPKCVLLNKMLVRKRALTKQSEKRPLLATLQTQLH